MGIFDVNIGKTMVFVIFRQPDFRLIYIYIYLGSYSCVNIKKLIYSYKWRAPTSMASPSLRLYVFVEIYSIV